jgi:hypothetical protein
MSMSRTRRRYEIAAAVPVVAVFAALYAWVVPTEGPNRWADMFWLAVLFAMPTVLWLFTSSLLVQHWWEGAGARVSTMDTPGQVLAAAVAVLPEPRRRWGEAMLGELAQVPGRSARWRFALSCARAALFLPLHTRRPVLAVAAAVVVAAVAAAYTLVGTALSGLGFFAAIFVAVVGITVVLAIARARRVRLPVPAATLVVTAAVAGAIAATAFFMAQHPTAAEGLPPARAAILAVALAGCLALAAAPPRRWGSSRLAPHLGVGAAVIFAFGLLAAARGNLGELVPFLWLFGPVFTFIVPAFIAAAAARSFRTGVQAGIWTAITVVPLNCALGLLEAARQYDVNGAWTFAGDATTAGFQVGGAIVALAVVPMVGFPFAVMGATAGALLHGAPPRSTRQA